MTRVSLRGASTRQGTAASTRRARRRQRARGRARPAARARAHADRRRRTPRPPTRGDAVAAHVALSAPRRSRSPTRQLATLAQSGMPLDQALVRGRRAGRRRARGEARRGAARRTSPPASRCRPRSRASRARSPPLYRGLVAAGAETGRLPDVLARLADYLEARQALRQKFIARAHLSGARDGHRVRA